MEKTFIIKVRVDKDTFAEKLKIELAYYFWSKCEWEIILSSWPPREDFKEEKIDEMLEYIQTYSTSVESPDEKDKSKIPWCVSPSFPTIPALSKHIVTGIF